MRPSGASAPLGLGLALTLIALLGAAFGAVGCGGQADAAGQQTVGDGLYDVACAVCVFGQTDGEGCPLAVRIGERIYPIEGATVAEHSICDAVQRARVEGALEGDVFVATSVTLVP